MRKSTFVAHALWLVGGGGSLGLHRFYLGWWRSGILYLLTLGLLGVGGASDLLRLPALVEAASRGERAPLVRWRPRLLVPASARGVIVALVALAALALALRGLGPLRTTVVVGGAGLLFFSLGVVVGEALLPLFAALLSRLHGPISGRSPGEPKPMLVASPGARLSADSIFDEAFLPLAAALAVSLWAVEGPQARVVSLLTTLGLSAVPFAAGLVVPILRVPAASGYKSARLVDGQVASVRPLAGRFAAGFGVTALALAVAQAAFDVDLASISLALGLALPVLLGTALFLDLRLPQATDRFERALLKTARMKPPTIFTTFAPPS